MCGILCRFVIETQWLKRIWCLLLLVLHFLCELIITTESWKSSHDASLFLDLDLSSALDASSFEDKTYKTPQNSHYSLGLYVSSLLSVPSRSVEILEWQNPQIMKLGLFEMYSATLLLILTMLERKDAVVGQQMYLASAKFCFWVPLLILEKACWPLDPSVATDQLCWVGVCIHECYLLAINNLWCHLAFEAVHDYNSYIIRAFPVTMLKLVYFQTWFYVVVI